MFCIHINRSIGWNDIGYSFVVGEDGNVYEARGWDSIGAHTKGYNSVGLGESALRICFPLIEFEYDLELFH